jgi:FtsP/CotA-like multicopper oxidase with cupredoxin domain
VAAAEAARRAAGAPVRDFVVVAEPGEIDLGGRPVATWGYRGRIPGPEIRLQAGEILRVRLDNRLPEVTSIHFHGIALRNDMDGVPDVTQPPVEPGEPFVYEFAVPHPGTFFYHPHVGMQLDRGLYAPLIVDDPEEPGDYDREVVLMLDDWTDGVGEDPDAILERLMAGGMGGMGNMGEGMSDMGDMGEGRRGMLDADSPLGVDAGDVDYPLYLVNGQPPDNPLVIKARPGERIRLRVINAGSDTAFRLAVGDHRPRVTHADGFPVEPVDVDAVLLGMGERYDVVVKAGDGVFPVVALAEGKGAQALAVLKTGQGDLPPDDVRVPELNGRLLLLDDLRATAAVAFAAREPDRTHALVLGGDMAAYRWTINGEVFHDAMPLEIREGERVRLVFDNRTMMFHPMHVHGHTFQVAGPGGVAGARKDTVNVPPGERILVDLEADNPGQWVIHCHNVYHAEAGMMTVLSYVAS